MRPPPSSGSDFKRQDSSNDYNSLSSVDYVHHLFGVMEEPSFHKEGMLFLGSGAPGNSALTWQRTSFSELRGRVVYRNSVYIEV
jgi:hypothetical protein